MAGINTDIENELRHSISRIENELEQLTIAYYELKGSVVRNALKWVLSIVLELLFWLLAITVFAFVIYMNTVEPAIWIELSEELSLKFSLEAELFYGAMLVWKVLLLSFSGLFALVALLFGRNRRKSRQLRAGALIIERLMHTTRANLDRAKERLKNFKDLAPEFDRKETERKGASSTGAPE